MEEDDDDFIYGPSKETSQPAPIIEQPVQPFEPYDPGEEDHRTPSEQLAQQEAVNGGLDEDAEGEDGGEEEVEVEVEGEDEEDEEEEESDIEIIVDAEERNKTMQRDFRPATNRTTSFGTPPPGSRAPHLTTEYTPTPRGEIPEKAPPLPPPLAAPRAAEDEKTISVSVQDTLSLPPATAPPSHPPLNISEPGVIDGHSIFEVDMDALSEKPWRRPGTDLSDYFNYGFDEISWEAYCYRRRELGEMADHLKGVVTNFAGMPEEQIAALPPEIRAMVMTAATSLMSGGAMSHGGPPMMGVGVGGPNPMMDMGMMGVMNGGDVQAMAGMMPVGVGDSEVMGMQGMQPDGYQPGGPGPGPGPGQMMGMGQEFGMQDPTMGMYPQNMEGNSGTPANVQGATPIPPQGPVASGPPGSRHSPAPGSVTLPINAPTAPAAARNPPAAPQAAFRGRPMSTPSMPMGMRGRGGFGRGRGRGGMYIPDGPAPQQIPVRPASPLPPNVPTGPRNQNRYKDRDGNAPAVEGLDYGGGVTLVSTDTDDRTARKRRASPIQEDPGRSTKRR